MHTIRTTAAVLLATSSLITGCASAQKAALKGTVLDKKTIEAQTTPALEALSPSLDVTKNSNGTSDFTLSMSASGDPDSPVMTSLRGIRRVSFVVRDRSGNAVDSVETTDIPTGEGRGCRPQTTCVESAPVQRPPMARFFGGR